MDIDDKNREKLSVREEEKEDRIIGVHKMDRGIYKTLISLATLIGKEQAKQVKEYQLAKELGIDTNRLRAYLKILADENFIQVQKNHKGEEYFTLTFKGKERMEAWKDELKQKSFLGITERAIKWILGGLAAALLGFALWYFGLSPGTANIQPLSASIPIRVYDMGTQPSPDPSIWDWFEFSAPSTYPVAVKTNTGEQSTMKAVLGEYVPASLSGTVTIKLDIENIAEKYQVDIHSIDVIVTAEAIKDIEDLYHIPVWGLGGGGTWQYELSLTPYSGKPLPDGSRLYHTKLITNGQPVDYIYVTPGERESLEISISLQEPAKYILVPVINYSFQDKNTSLEGNPINVVYPKKYRTWVIDPNRAPPFGTLDTSHFIVDTRTGLVEQDIPPASLNSCFPDKKWIFFAGAMVNYGVSYQTFVIDTQGENLRLLDSQYTDPRESLNVAWAMDGMVRLKFPNWTENKPNEDLYEVFNPNSGQKVNWSTDTENSILASVQYGGTIDNTIPINSPDGTREVFIKGAGPNDNSCDPNHGQQIFLRNTNGGAEKLLTPAAGFYSDLSWSPDGKFIMYASARPGDNGGQLSCDNYNEDKFRIYSLEMMSGIEHQLTDKLKYHSSPTWSQDGQWVVSGGDRLTVSRRDGSCIQTLLVSNFGSISDILLQP